MIVAFRGGPAIVHDTWLLLLFVHLFFLLLQVKLCAVQPVHSACGSAADGVCPVHTSGSRQAQIPESGLAGRM